MSQTNFLCKTEGKWEIPFSSTPWQGCCWEHNGNTSPDLQHSLSRRQNLLCSILKTQREGEKDSTQGGMVGIWTLPLVSRSCSSTGGNPRLIAWVTEVHQFVEYGHTSGCEWDLLEWHNTDMRPKTTHLVLKVSSVLRCCLWTNRLTLNQVYPIPAYVSYFCSMKQRYILQVRWAQACLLQQNLLSPVQNQQEIYFMPGKWKPWLKYGQIHLSSLKSETKTGKKSVTGIKDAVQLSLVCTFCVTLEVRETVYTYPWDDKWRLNETIHVEFHLYPEHMLLWNVHRISIPNPWEKKKTPSKTSVVWRTCRDCCNLALGRLSMAVSKSKKAKTKILIFSSVLPSWLWSCPCADCCASPGGWHTLTLVFSMGREWATVTHQLLRLLNFLELSEHIELFQCSQARKDCLNLKYCWYILSVLSATDCRQHFFIYAEGLGIHVWWIKKTLASTVVQDHH